MKTVIRQGVWETNSSSTHSFTLCKSSASTFDVLSSIADEHGANIEDRYQEYVDDHFNIIIDYIKRPDGDESAISFTRISSFPAKIALLYMFAYDYAWENWNKPCGKTRGWNGEEVDEFDNSVKHVKELLEQNEIGKKFIETIAALVKSKGYNGIKYSDNFSTYHYNTYECMWDDTNKNANFLDSADTMIDTIKKVVDEATDVVWHDVPYSLSSYSPVKEITTI